MMPCAAAQELGYAEADPTNDVEGIDAAYKLAILSTLAFRARIKDSDVYREGITRLDARDFLYARELGYTIKLLAIANMRDGVVEAHVHPAFVPSDVMLAKVEGVLNAVEVEADMVGRVLFTGPGAGSRAHRQRGRGRRHRHRPQHRRQRHAAHSAQAVGARARKPDVRP